MFFVSGFEVGHSMEREREREFVKTTMTEGDVKCGGFLAEV